MEASSTLEIILFHNRENIADSWIDFISKVMHVQLMEKLFKNQLQVILVERLPTFISFKLSGPWRERVQVSTEETQTQWVKLRRLCLWIYMALVTPRLRHHE